MVMLLTFPALILALDVVPWILLDVASEALAVYVMASVHSVCHLVVFGNIVYWIHGIGRIADKFGIGTELKAINLCFVAFVFLREVVEVATFGAVHRSYYVLAATLCNALSILPSLYIGSLFVLRRLLADHAAAATMRDFRERNLLRALLFCGRKPRGGGGEDERASPEMEDELFSLNEVLSTRIGFEKFTQFLISELSVENILFLVEVKQFKACCRALLSYICCTLSVVTCCDCLWFAVQPQKVRCPAASQCAAGTDSSADAVAAD